MQSNVLNEIKKDNDATRLFAVLGQELRSQCFNLTDLGNSRRLVAKHGHNIRFCHVWGKWLIWNGKYWIIDTTGEIFRFAKDTVVDIYREAAEAEDEEMRKALASHAKRSESESRIKAMVSLSESEPGVPVTPDQLDSSPYLINCKNGTINFKTGELKQHSRADLITKYIPTDYDAKAEFSEWYKFLDKIFNGNIGLIKFVQRAVGYSMTGNISEQCFFILFGSGANGKSTFLEILRLLFNDFAQQTPIETFMMRENTSNSNDLARLQGTRLVTASEISEGRRLNESLIKQITGGDRITARFLHREFFEFTPQFKLWIATNHKPVIRGTDNGIWRRIRLIPFEVCISPGDQDKDLINKLKSELPGILNWSVMGCMEWQQKGLDAPEKVINATDSYRSEMDVLSAFIDECCVITSACKTKVSELYRKYMEWCKFNGENELTQIKFGIRLTERGFEKFRGTGGTWYWKGIGLKYEHDNENENPFEE